MFKNRHFLSCLCRAMKSKNIPAILTAIAVLTMMTAYINPTTVLASSDSSDHPDNAGDASSQLARSDDFDDEETPGGAMGDHSREGGAAGDAPFNKNPLTGEDDKPGRLGLGTLTGGNPGELLCDLADEPFSSEEDDVEC
jgi:hypothetical protein